MGSKEETPPGDGGGAFAFISKGWREVRDSASADLRLMRARADSVRARADRELEHLLASAASALAPPLPPVATGAPIAEVEFVRKRIQPKIQELRRHYSSRALDARWPPGAGASSLRIDLSGITAIRNAIVAEGEGADRWRIARPKGDQDEEGRKEWEVVRMIQSGLKEFERRSLSSDMFAGFRGRGEFVEKFKLSMLPPPAAAAAAATAVAMASGLENEDDGDSERISATRIRRRDSEGRMRAPRGGVSMAAGQEQVNRQHNQTSTWTSPVKITKRIQIKRRQGSRASSEVWDHFTPDETKDGPIAVCNYCHQVYMCNRSIHGTSTLRKHLMNLCVLSPFWDPEKRRKITHEEHHFNVEDCRKALAKMVIVDEMPFNVVEGEGFKGYSKTLEPRFDLPSRITVARDCMKIYLEEKTRLKNSMKGHRICFTIDTWTSGQNLNYMSLTAHWVDDEWVLQKRVINFCLVPDHKGKTLGEKIEECLLEWDIDNIFTITIDNASSNDSAITYLKTISKDWKGIILGNEFIHIRCCCHIVNLIVKSGLEFIDPSISKIRKAVRYVRSSPGRLDQFKKCVEKEKISDRSLLTLDVETRWNSTYLMLESSVKFEKAFFRLAKDNKTCISFW